jgi:hypothetical protein
MPSKLLKTLLFDWLLKPLDMVTRYFRTDFSVDGQNIIIKRPFSRNMSVRFDELDEIGVETTDQGPFVEDVILILRRGDMRFRIGGPCSVFVAFMQRFDSLENFDWRPFIEAQGCTDNRYFSCWRRPSVRA